MIGSITPNSNLRIRDTQTMKGRGVFASKRYKAGEIVEVCPVLILDTPWEDMPAEIQSMVYDWGHATDQESNVQFALALGPGSLFNHASPPILSFAADSDQRAMVYTAAVDIEPGTELTIDYNGDVEEGGPDWFESMGITPL